MSGLHSAAALPVPLLAGLSFVTAALGPPLSAQESAGPEIETQVGFVTLHHDRQTGEIFLEIHRLDEEILYYNGLAAGLGSAEPTRLDRGQTGAAQVVTFERRGPKVLLVRHNTERVAGSGDPSERRAVEQAFPRSVLASLPVVAGERVGAGAGSGVVVNATDFLLSDVWDVEGTIHRSGMGEARLDRDRSYIVDEYTGAFPMNTEVRASLTFVSDDPGPVLRHHAPDGRSVTLEQHHSFTELPDPPLRPRRYNPRLGVGSHVLENYSRPLDEDFRFRTVPRWRLEPSDPEAYLEGELVEPVEPIVFYLDPGITEPYRSAYREGVLWWNGAFEAAGFRNAVEVRDLPEDVDQMDARYSVLQVVHRTSPGPSTGNSYRDPRTGEMIQALTQMDSYRSLVDFNIYAGMLPAFDALGIEPQLDGEEFAMARRRQHAAHEIGHVLGLPHTHSGASQGRSSVMDYPFPLVRVDDEGRLDISDAYRDGIGYSDSLTIRYAYTWYPDEASEREGLAEIVREALDRGHRYITGSHARDLGGAQPDSHMWWEGEEPFSALDRTMEVRRIILEHFDEEAIRPDEPMAWLNHRLAHAYLHHRYTVEAVVKYVGGMRFDYALRSDGDVPTEVIAATEQRRALERIAEVISPAEIAVPERVVELIPPAPPGFEERVPWIPSPAGPALDPVAIARSFSQEVVDNLFHRERMARVASFHARHPNQVSLDEVFSEMVEATWGATRLASSTERAYARAGERAVLDGLFTLASDEEAVSEVRDGAEQHLARLAEWIEANPGDGAEEEAHRARARREIERYLSTGEVPALRTGVIELFLPGP